MEEYTIKIKVKYGSEFQKELFLKTLVLILKSVTLSHLRGHKKNEIAINGDLPEL